MIYTLDSGKQITIPDAEIQKLEKTLSLSREDAIYTWLCDEDYLTDETEQELTTRAKKNRITATIHQAKSDNPRKPIKRERKPDVEKEKIIEILANFLQKSKDELKIDIEFVEITNKSKIIEFSVGENHYKLDLIKKRPPKK